MTESNSNEPQRRSRHLRVGATAALSGASRGLLLVGTLATVPLVLADLGEERLGVWLTLVTVTTLLGFADLGLGNGIMNQIALAGSSDDNGQLRVIVGNGFALLTLVAFALAAFLIALERLIDIGILFGLEQPEPELARAVRLFVLLFLAGIPFTVTEKVQWGLQRGYLAGAWALLGSSGAVLGIVFSTWRGYGLAGVAIAYTGAPLVAALANTAWTFGRRWRHLRPKRADLSVTAMRGLLSIGSLYFALQLAAAIAFSSDNFIVSFWLGPDQVADLAVPARLFGLITFGLATALRPMWPEFADAIGRRRFAWVRRTSLRMLAATTAVSTVSAVILVGIGRPIAYRLTEGTTDVSLGLLIALALGTVLTAAGNALAMLYNALGEVRFQVLTAIAMAVVVISLKILLVQRLGVLGVAIAGATGYALITGTAFAVRTPKVLTRLATSANAVDDQRSEDWSGA